MTGYFCIFPVSPPASPRLPFCCTHYLSRYDSALPSSVFLALSYHHVGLIPFASLMHASHTSIYAHAGCSTTLFLEAAPAFPHYHQLNAASAWHFATLCHHSPALGSRIRHFMCLPHDLYHQLFTAVWLVHITLARHPQVLPSEVTLPQGCGSTDVSPHRERSRTQISSAPASGRSPSSTVTAPFVFLCSRYMLLTPLPCVGFLASIAAPLDLLRVLLCVA